MSSHKVYFSPAVKVRVLHHQGLLCTSSFDPRYGTEYLQGDDDYVI